MARRDRGSPPPCPSRAGPGSAVSARRLPWWTAALALAVASTAAPRALAAADAQLMGATMAAEIPRAAAGAAVTVRYRLAVDPGTAEVRLRGLEFFGTELVDVTATVDGGRVPFRLDRAETRTVGGSLRLPAASRDDGEVELILRYTVRRGIELANGRFDAVLPLLLPEMRPSAAPEGFFTAEARLPRAYTVTESFPTVRRTVVAEGEMKRVSLALQVVPAMVRWRGVSGDAPFLTFARKVDLGVAAVILGLLLLGYRRLNRTGSA